MTSDVTVSIVDVVSRERPPASIVEYAVRNEAASTIWLVADGWVVWRQEDREITLSLARARMRPGVEVFGYFDPAVEPVTSGQTVARTLTLEWPLELSRIWNAERTVAPEPGRYSVRVEVGFGRTPAPSHDIEDDASGVEAPVLRWQETALSPPALLAVPDWREQLERNSP